MISLCSDNGLTFAPAMTLPNEQHAQLTEKGISESEIEQQLEYFREGTEYVKLLRPASIGDGILKLDRDERDDAIQLFEELRSGLKIEKFVPSSGAASRMFTEIQKWIETPSEHRPAIKAFFAKIENLAVYEEWAALAHDGKMPDHYANLDSKIQWLELLLSEEGLELGGRPKALIPFHKKDGEARLALEEHVAEGLQYAVNDGVLSMHFTISPDHEAGFRAAFADLEKKYEGKAKLDISYSYQLPNKDTLTVNNELVPLTDREGNFVFRPGGHGALIHNLNERDADIIFIKNIDNVCHPDHLRQTVDYKMALAGKLLELRADFQGLWNQIQKGLVDERSINEVRNKWKLRIPRDYRKLRSFINRPMRVCGMVKNEGEPGGGPFFSIDKNYGESLQIIEKNQVDPEVMRQQAILKSSTHFNPVDLVVSLKTIEGKKLDLKEYVDDSLYFISDKNHEGEDVKALEWPGLWNGAMSNWVTVFVEVPTETFNPVKEFPDLLRPLHQAR